MPSIEEPERGVVAVLGTPGTGMGMVGPPVVVVMGGITIEVIVWERECP